MKTTIGPALRRTLALLVLLSVIYPLIVAGIAKLAPGGGNGVTVSVGGKSLVTRWSVSGLRFTEDRYFNGRPSAVGYNAAGSGGSNKGPSNPDYLREVRTRIDTFLVHNPGVSRRSIPSELVTASGSGLDPDRSPAGAKIQVARLARVRGLPADRLHQLVDAHTKGPLLGLFGPSTVNVLALNVALDGLK